MWSEFVGVYQYVNIVYCKIFRPLKGHHQTELLVIIHKRLKSSSSYSAKALSICPWLPLQLMPIPLYPMLSFSIVSQRASLNHLPRRLSTWVWFVLCLLLLILISFAWSSSSICPESFTWFMNNSIFPGWGCQPHAQPPAILEDRCFLSGVVSLSWPFPILTLNISRGVHWGPQRVIFCDPAVTISTNLLLIFVCVPHQLKMNIM